MGARGIISEEFRNKKKVTYYITNWIVDKLKTVGNQSRFVEDCIIQHTGWTKPRGYKSKK